MAEVSADKVGRDIVRAVRKNKEFVLHPKRAAPLQALHSAPSKISRAALAGIKFR